jgi:multicomponent Na+:H+ antiporter subunit C
VTGLLPYLAAAWVALWALHGVVTSRHGVHLVICLAVLQSATYLLLLGVGWRDGGAPPVMDRPLPPAAPVVDPIVQALMLTDVVVEATVSALLLAIVVRAHVRTGKLDPDTFDTMRG